MASPHTLIVLFDAIVLVGVVLLTCTLLPALFSNKIQRSGVWYSMIAAWLVFAVSYGLLVGKQDPSSKPPFGLCVFQTVLVYAVPPLVSLATLCYFIEFTLIIYNLKRGSPIQYGNSRSLWLIIIPWIFFCLVILEILMLIFPGKHLDLVERADNHFYCHLRYNIPNQVTAALIISATAILLPLEIWTGATMYWNWDVFKRLSQTDRQIVLALYIRLTFCTLSATIAFIFAMLAFIFPEPDAISVVYPIVPILIALGFGTQKDILRVWLFWRHAQPYGSIIFNNGTVLTTNIRTSRGISGEMSVQRRTAHDKSQLPVQPSEAGTTNSDPTSTSISVTKEIPETASNARHVDGNHPEPTQHVVQLEVSGSEQTERGA